MLITLTQNSVQQCTLINYTICAEGTTSAGTAHAARADRNILLHTPAEDKAGLAPVSFLSAARGRYLGCKAGSSPLQSQRGRRKTCNGSFSSGGPAGEVGDRAALLALRCQRTVTAKEKRSFTNHVKE